MRPIHLTLAVASLVAACSFRGFSPPPEAYEEFALKGKFASIEQIKKEMIDCGYQPQWSWNAIPGEKTYNESAQRQECMFKKGFYYKTGWGGYCSVPEYRATLPICAAAPIRPRSGYYGQ